MAAQALAGAVTDQVVEGAKRTGAQTRNCRWRTCTARECSGNHTKGERGAFEQSHRTTRVVRPSPSFEPTGRVAPQQGGRG
jgi:hypothetical protein